MTVEAVLIKVEENDHLAEVLDRAARQLDNAGDELLLDFSSVLRIDSRGLQALEELVALADEKSAKISVRGVNISIYKVLKLMKVANRLLFVS